MHMMMIAALASQIFCESPDAAKENEMFADTRFERGFVLSAASHPAPKIEIGTLQTGERPASEPPAWRLAQWGTRYLLEPGVCTKTGDDTWAAGNPAKRIVVTRAGSDATSLSLEVRGNVEYAGHMRATGEAWPHLLIEQRFDAPIRLDTLKHLAFGVAMRVPFCKAAAETMGKLNPGLHAAQVAAFWTVHNMTSGSPDDKDMIWFGIPFFDVRHEVPPPHYALDTGKGDASGKFICSLDGKRFWTGRTGDGEWRKLDTDLLPLLREALAITQQHGHLKNTRFEDLAITSFNLGWEMPGPYDAAIEFRGLSMKAERK